MYEGGFFLPYMDERFVIIYMDELHEACEGRRKYWKNWSLADVFLIYVLDFLFLPSVSWDKKVFVL